VPLQRTFGLDNATPGEGSLENQRGHLVLSTLY
jgi:hypothetical protein